MSVAGYNHQDTEDCLGIDTHTTQPNAVATVYIGSGWETSGVELTLDELRAFSAQVNNTLNEIEAKQAQESTEQPASDDRQEKLDEIAQRLTEASAQLAGTHDANTLAHVDAAICFSLNTLDELNAKYRA